MSEENDYRATESTQVYDTVSHGGSDDYVEVDTHRKVGSTAPADDHSYVHDKISVVRSYLVLSITLASAVALVLIFILLIATYTRINALDTSAQECHGQFNESVLNGYEKNQELLFNHFQRVMANTSSTFLRLLLDFQEKLSNNLEDALVRKSYIANYTSCADVLYHYPSSSSGYYLVWSSTGHLVRVYCDMTRTCGNITGGWMKVAELDLNNCFTGLKSKSFEGNRTCVINEDAAGCTPVQFSSFNIQYSKVCSKIRGYGIGTVDGFYLGNMLRGMSISDNYLDGVSISSNGNHIWSFAAGRCENCDRSPSFVSNDWSCDGSSCSGEFCGQLLWNTSICGEGGFTFKQLSSSFTTDITMKVCRDEDRENEDIALAVVEIYVQ